MESTEKVSKPEFSVPLYDVLLKSDTSVLKDGELRLLRAYTRSQESGFTMLVITDICWEQELPDMIHMLQAGTVRSFILADTSTGLMRTLHAFLNAGFEVTGPITLVKQPVSYWDTPILGLEMKMKE